MIGKITLHIAYYHTKTKHKHFITTGVGEKRMIPYLNTCSDVLIKYLVDSVV